ncbi:hypothetical protein Desaf_2544 [Desulfocurvibacter africanus subsp. africanus str. Walvis Bay]|uniref:Uncharacterized protein n=1 Tax=Desulfocurvibacter africanus subsp. africanus str. Walvis Bay TaxID=690850 RepID=F3YZR1_DESAF|nr:hypothetical protein Desaf_2544 [Desulfocurvibacter africanus subsp. africanus str. Walvis Bay]
MRLVVMQGLPGAGKSSIMSIDFYPSNGFYRLFWMRFSTRSRSSDEIGLAR